ncbi:hypothetical protein OG535_39875 [Kitasatospora sp. NBC_00085]|uniref:hypothetical protein n=1 Tax=unclassified Kitasatospora TaxID=2633591 RepID=UPI0032515AB3
MAGQATWRAIGHQRGAAGLATGALALLLAVAGCSSTGTGAAPSASAPPVRPAEPASPTATASPTVPLPPVPQPTSPEVVPSALAPEQPPEPSEAPAVIYECDGRSLSSPRSFALACGNGAAQLDGLVWKGWGGLSPTATGRLWEKNAAGGVAAVPATVTLGGLTGGDYTTMRISAPKADRPNLDLTLGKSGPTPKG